MPCRTYEDDEPTPSKKEDNKWEAAFCALTSTLKTNSGDDILQTLLQVASKNSGMNLIELYEEHKESDINRLKKDLSKYSSHELEALKEILNNNG